MMGSSRKRHPTPFLLIVTAGLILLLPIALFAAPSGSNSIEDDPLYNSCYSTCKTPSQSSTLKGYVAGSTFVYDFGTEGITKLPNTSDEEVRVRIRGLAHIYVNESCPSQLLLTVKNTSILNIGPIPTSIKSITEVDGRKALEGSTVRFEFEDGVIGGLCFGLDDPSWSVNLKKGLVSMLQNKPPNVPGDVVQETDVSGTCPTTYAVTGDIFTKTKALGKCTQRDGGIWILQGTSYVSTQAERNTFPVLDSKQKFVQTITDGIIREVSFSETHTLTILSPEQGQAISTFSTTLKYKSKNEGKVLNEQAQHVNVPSSILYDHSKTDVSAESSSMASQTIRTIVDQLCFQTLGDTVSPVVPEVTNSLHRTMKSVKNVHDFDSTYNVLVNNANCSVAAHKIFITTTAKAATTESISFMISLIEAGKVDNPTKTLFNLYSSFAPNPDSGSLKSYTKLVNKKNVDSETILAASALAHRYCHATNKDCLDEVEYTNLVNSIVKIGEKTWQSKDESTISLGLSALQALGNMDHLTSEAVVGIKECLNSSNRIKMVALQAFRRDACEPQLKENAYEILKDEEMSSEVRIEAYLAFIQCIQDEDVGKIQDVLNVLRSNQVGSFLMSHITNTRQSKIPTKVPLQRIFQRLVLPRSDLFPNDPTKFSRNFEYSTFDQRLNLGCFMDANSIFSQDSYIPRQINTQFKCLYYGREYSGEVSIGAECYEHFVEKYFGPLGTVTKAFMPQSTSILSRKKRNVGNEVDKSGIEDKLLKETKISNRCSSNGVGDVSLRLLETTILTKSFNEMEMFDYFLSSDILPNFNNLYDAANGYNVDLTSALTPLQEELVVPSGSGLPITLQLELGTIFAVQLKGKLDLEGIFRGDSIPSTNLRFVPSAAALLRGKMSMGSGPVEAGLQVQGKVHFSSGIDIGLEQDEGKFELKLNLPQDDVTVVGARTQLLWVQSEKMTMKESPINSKFGKKAPTPISFDSEVTGLRISAQFQTPSPGLKFPMGGDSSFWISIGKMESSMDGYLFRLETTSQSQSQKSISLTFDTPHSVINRKVEANGRYFSGPSPKFDLELITPGQRQKFEYQKWGEVEKSGYELCYSRDNSEYWIGAIMEIKEDSTTTKSFHPLVAYKLPSGSGTFVEGKVTREDEKELTFDLKFIQALGSSLTTALTGRIERNRVDNLNSNYALDKVELGNDVYGKILLEGSGDFMEVKKSLNLVATYGLESQKNKIVFNTELAQPTSTQDNLALFLSSSSRALSLDVKLERVERLDGIQTNFSLKNTNGNEALTFDSLSLYKFTSRNLFDMHNSIQLKCTKFGIDWALKGDAKSNPVEQVGDLYLRLGSHTSAIIKYNANGEDFSSYVFSSIVKLGEQLVEFNETAEKVSPIQWKYETDIYSQLDQKNPFTLKAKTDLRMKDEVNDMQTQIISQISSSALDQPVTWDSNVRSLNNAYHSHLKLTQPIRDILKLTTDFYRNSDASSNFTSTVFLTNYLDARFENNNGRGVKALSNIQVDATWIPTARKIKSTSILKKENEAYICDGQIDWDFGRNPMESVAFKSVTTPKTRYFNSSNSITVMGVRRGLDLIGGLSNDYYNGQNFGSIMYTSSGQNYEVKIENVNEESRKVKASALGVNINFDKEEPIYFKGSYRAANVNISKFVYDFSSNVSLTSSNTNILNVQAQTKSLLTNRRTVTALLDASGAVIKTPLSIDYKLGIQKTKVKSLGLVKYGTKVGTMEFDVEVDQLSPRKRLDMKYIVDGPFTSRVNATYKLAAFYTAYDNFDYSNSGSVELNGQTPTNWDATFSFLNKNFTATYNLSPNGRPLVTFSTKGSIGKKDVSFNSFLGLDSGFNAQFQLETNRDLSTVKLVTTANTSYSGYETIGLKVFHRNKFSTGQNFTTTTIQGSIVNETVTLGTRLDFNPNQLFAFRASLTDSKYGLRKVLYTWNTSNNKYSLESLVAWGGGDFISTNGTLFRTDSSIGGDLTVNSPTFKLDRWTVEVTQANALDGNVYSIKTRSGLEEKGSVIVQYLKHGRSNVNGTVNVKYGGNEWGASFDYNRILYTHCENEEQGLGTSLTLKLDSDDYPIKIVIGSKRTIEETFYETQFCTTKALEDCRSVNVRYKKNVRGHDILDGFDFSTTFCSAGDVECKKIEVVKTIGNNEKEFWIKLKSTTDGKMLVDGIVVKSIGQYNVDSIYKYSVKVVSNGGQSAEEDEDAEPSLGVTYFYNRSQPTTVTGIDVQILERQIGGLYKFRNDEVEEHIFEGNMNIHALPSTEPNQNIILSIIFDKVDSYEFALRHPKLTKDLRVSSQIKQKKGGFLYETKTTFDLFKSTQDPLTLILNIKEGSVEPNAGPNYIVNLNLDGLIKMKTKSEIREGDGEYYAKTAFEYENNLREIKSFNATVHSGLNHRSIEVIGRGGTKFSYSIQYSPNTPNGQVVKREILIPGMDNSLILERIDSFSTLPSTTLKLYNANTNNAKYMFWTGFKSLLQYSTTLSSNNGMMSDELADFTLALNSSRLLFLKSTWNKNMLIQSLNESMKALTAYSQELMESRDKFVNDLMEEGRNIKRRISQGLPNLRPVVEFYLDEFHNIEEELREANIVNSYLRPNAEFLLNIIGTDFEEIKQSAARMSSYIVKSFKRVFDLFGSMTTFINETVQELSPKFAKIWEGVGKSGAIVREYLINKFITISNSGQKLISTLSTNFYDIPQQLGASMKDAIVRASNEGWKIWEAVESKSRFVQQLTIFRDYVEYYSLKYETILALALSDFKRDLETWKNYFVTLFPEEGQECLLTGFEYIMKKVKEEGMDTQRVENEMWNKCVNAFGRIQSNMLTLDLPNGHLMARIPLPVSVNSLAELNASISSQLFEGMEVYNAQSPSFSFNLVNFYNLLKAPKGFTRILPIPNTVRGQVIGSHFKTFDNKFYHFEGKCKYLLAGDFVDHNFTITIDYTGTTNSQVKKSITLTNLRDSITITPDYAVLVNGQVSNVPASSGELKVEKGNDEIKAYGPSGFSVTVHTRHDLWDIDISGFYLGKTNGLLGTYNNELFDDYNSPNGKIMGSVEEMVGGWKVNNECQEVRDVNRELTPDLSNVVPECSNEFDSSTSILRPCFHMVKPTAYQWVCESLKAHGYEANRAVCAATTAYQSMCNDLAPIQNSPRCVN